MTLKIVQRELSISLISSVFLSSCLCFIRISFSFCLFHLIHVSLICFLFLMLSHSPCFCLILCNLSLTLSLLFVSNCVSCLISSLSRSGLLLFYLVVSHLICSPIFFGLILLFCFSYGFLPHFVDCFSHMLLSHFVLSH